MAGIEADKSGVVADCRHVWRAWHKKGRFFLLKSFNQPFDLVLSTEPALQAGELF